MNQIRYWRLVAFSFALYAMIDTVAPPGNNRWVHLAITLICGFGTPYVFLPLVDRWFE